jgi:hypothetical protein
MRSAVIVAGMALVVLTGCGSQHGHGDGVYDPRDSRIKCLTDAGLQARKSGPSDVLVTTGPRPPLRIFFANTPGEAESIQVSGRAQGAEQLGRALLFVADASEPLLSTIEGCLDDN